MGYHINERGQFQSDRHPLLPPDKVVVSFQHAVAWPVLLALADAYEPLDREFAKDVRERVRTIQVQRRVDGS